MFKKLSHTVAVAILYLLVFVEYTVQTDLFGNEHFCLLYIIELFVKKCELSVSMAKS